MFTSKSKWLRFQQAAKLVTSLQEVLPVVTSEAVVEAVQRANAAEQMMTMFQAAAQDPVKIKDVVDVFSVETDAQGNLVAPTPQRQAAFSALVFEGLTRLPQVNPQAFQRVLAVHNQHTLTALRDRARTTVNTAQEPDAQAQAVNLALRFEQAITGGRFTPSQQWLASQTVDPVEAGRQQLERDRANFQRQQQQVEQTRQQQWMDHVGTSQDAAQMAEVDTHLASVLNKPEFAPYRDKMRQDLFAAIRNEEAAHPEWGQKWESLNTQALTNPSDFTLKQVTDFRREIARQAARRNAATVISFYSNVVLSNNQAAHARAAQTVTSELAPNGAASSPSNGVRIDAAVKAKGWNGVMEAMGW